MLYFFFCCSASSSRSRFAAAGLSKVGENARYVVDVSALFGFKTVSETAEPAATTCLFLNATATTTGTGTGAVTTGNNVTWALSTGASADLQRVTLTLPASAATATTVSTFNTTSGNATTTATGYVWAVQCAGVWMPRYAVAAFSNGFAEFYHPAGATPTYTNTSSSTTTTTTTTDTTSGAAYATETQAFLGLSAGVLTGAYGLVEPGSNNTAPLITTPLRVVLAPLPALLRLGDMLAVPVPAAFNYVQNSRGTTACTMRREGSVLSTSTAWEDAPGATATASWGGALSAIITVTFTATSLPSKSTIALELLCTQVRNPSVNLTSVVFSEMRVLRTVNGAVVTVAATEQGRLNFTAIKIPEWGTQPLRTVTPASTKAGSAAGELMVALAPVPVFIAHYGGIGFRLPVGT